MVMGARRGVCQVADQSMYGRSSSMSGCESEQRRAAGGALGETVGCVGAVGVVRMMHARINMHKRLNSECNAMIAL